MENWSQTVTYTAQRLAAPTTVEQVQALVADSSRLKALGSRHSFNDAADTPGIQVSVVNLPPTLRLNGTASGPTTVTCAAGLTHSQVADFLYPRGLALANMASLPHISVGGAIQTGTHGSGLTNPVLSASVTAIDLVDANGDLRTLTREMPDFGAVVVGLGAHGVVTAVTHEVTDAFSVEQHVYEGARWEAVLHQLPALMGSAYSVSLFTRFDSDRFPQVWIKQKTAARTEIARDLLQVSGARPATRALHPLPDTPAGNVTQQLGVPGASHHRLPHFRQDFQPSRGDEIQSEYLVDISRAHEALQAVRRMGHLVAPALHMAEVRCVAADDAWVSPSGGRVSLAIHFTWKRNRDQVNTLIPLLEEVLLPLGARPHWGKVFSCGYADLVECYPKLDDFAELVRTYDPDRKFDNEFLQRVLGPG